MDGVDGAGKGGETDPTDSKGGLESDGLLTHLVKCWFRKRFVDPLPSKILFWH